MKVVIITVAGISSRFNQGLEEDGKVLKCLYSEDNEKNTLLFHLIKKCSYADRIIIVGGYKFDDLRKYYKDYLYNEFTNINLIENPHYSDYGSGYSLYLGIKAALKYSPEEILFVEGDLDIDFDSMKKVIDSEKSVLTYNFEPIHANKAVVVYLDSDGKYKYAFNSSHGLLSIDEPFSCILNSGQIWKFKNIGLLDKANEEFFDNNKEGTNLEIIQRYFDKIEKEDILPVALKRWTNCNTRNDYKMIKMYWKNEF